MNWLLPLAQATQPYSRPFLQPLPVWDYWWALLFPLLLGICVVYKTIKVSDVREVPRAALTMMFWVIAAFIGAAVGLVVFVRLMQ